MSTDAVAPGSDFEWDASWQVHPKVSIRPERFGALLYHFETRRLSFVKTPTLLQVLRSLASERDARAAAAAAGVRAAELPAYGRALATLATSSMICKRSPS